MSWVWTVMVSFSDEEYWRDEEEEARTECEALQNINAWLNSDETKQYGPLTSLTVGKADDRVGMQANLYGGGFKHFDMEQFLAVVKRQEWQDPTCVQVFIKGEEDQQFTVLALQKVP